MFRINTDRLMTYVIAESDTSYKNRMNEIVYTSNHLILKTKHNPLSNSKLQDELIQNHAMFELISQDSKGTAYELDQMKEIMKECEGKDPMDAFSYREELSKKRKENISSIIEAYNQVRGTNYSPATLLYAKL